MTSTVVREFRVVFDDHRDETRGCCVLTTVVRGSASDDHSVEKGGFAIVVSGKDAWCFGLGSDGCALTTVGGVLNYFFTAVMSGVWVA